jgi:hypothetical protein
MPSSRALPAALVTAGLLLAGCSSSGGPGASDSFSPAPVTAPPSATSAPSPTTSASPRTSGSPRFAFPKDTKLVFQYGDTGNPKQNAVLRDLRTFWTAYYYATLDPRERRHRYLELSVGSGAQFFRNVIKGYRREGRGVVGSKTFFRPTVTVHGEKALVQECQNERHFFPRDLQSNRPVTNESSATPWYLTEEQLTLSQGRWKVSSFSYERGAPICKG